LEQVYSTMMKGDKNMKDSLDEKYETPLTPELFAEKFNYSPAFVRLAIECGLDSPGGKITAVAFCNWFVKHYNNFRKMAGLALLKLPTETMTAEEREYTTVGNILKTHADYFASRSSSLGFKKAWRDLSNEYSTCAKKYKNLQGQR